MIRFADLFSGCGGLTSGFAAHTDFTGLLSVDNWPIAGKTFRHNLLGMPHRTLDLHDPSTVDELVDELSGRCDLLLGGPPCQGFSTMGIRRDGDRRSTLVDVFVDVALRVKPRFLLMENVTGIVSKRHPSGSTYADTAVSRLERGEGGFSYSTSSLVVRAIEYGVAQTRKRWFLLAIRDDLPDPDRLLAELLGAIEARKTAARPSLRDAIGDLPIVGPGGGAEEVEIRRNRQSSKVYNHRAMNHTNRLIERFSHVPPGGGLPDVPRDLLTPHLIRMLDGHYGSGGHVKNIYGRMRWEDASGTIVAGMDKITCGRFVHPEEHRLLTPRECARIQTFDDNFQFFGSLVNQYYMIGNAVPPAVSRVFAEAIAGMASGIDDLEYEYSVVEHDHI